MFIPVFLTTVILGYLTLSRGGKRDGVLILAASIVVLPAFTLIAPIFTTALLGKLTGKGDKVTTSKSTPARSAAPIPVATTQPSSTNNAGPAAAPASSEDGAKDARKKAIISVINDFFIALDADRFEQSFDAASASFREGVTKAEWVEFQRKNRLKFGKPTDHRTKTIDTNTDVSTGKQTFLVPVASTFEKGAATETVTVVLDPDQRYRVSDYTLAVNSALPPPSAAAGSLKMPGKNIAAQMAGETLENFRDAINSGDFSLFYETQLSERWKRETKPKSLETTFRPFIDKRVDLTPIFKVDPVLEPAPSLDSDGLLVLKGYYPLVKEKVKVAFELRYSPETKWALSGINVQINPISK